MFNRLIKMCEMSKNSPNKICIFNKKSRNLFSIGVIISLIATMIPINQKNLLVKATDEVIISKEIFITKDELLTFCEETNDGEGLLKTGDGTKDKKIRINLGTRAESTNFIGYKGDDDTEATAIQDTPITWLVAGGSDENVILFAEYPIIGGYSYNEEAQNADGAIKSYFNESTGNKTYDATISDGYELDKTVSVSSNHWGASDLRSSMQSILNKTYFTDAEKNLFLDSTVYTEDFNNIDSSGKKIKYKTTDKFYAPAVGDNDIMSTQTQVGDNDEFTIHTNYNGGSHWTRTNCRTHSNKILYSWPYLATMYSDSNTKSQGIQPVCKLGISDVIFASAAFENEDTQGFSEIVKSRYLEVSSESADYEIDETLPALTLRLDGSETLDESSTLNNTKGTTLNYKIGDGERLVIVCTDEDGKTYQYVKSGEADDCIDIKTVEGLPEGKSFSAKAWIEKGVDADSHFTYATEPVDIVYDANELIPDPSPSDPETPSYPGDNNETEQPSDRPDLGETMITIKGIKHYIDKDGRRSVIISRENTDTNGIVWLKEESYDINLGHDTATWYGLDNSEGVFDEGSILSIHWYNKKDNPEKFAFIDESHQVDSDKCYCFDVIIINSDGTLYEGAITLLAQFGEDWDEDDFKAYYISQGVDEPVTASVNEMSYPEGVDTFGFLDMPHLSPYFIYDELTDEEKAEFDKLTDEEKTQLDAIAKELASKQEEKSAEANEISNNGSAKTGDEIIYFTISGLGLIMTLALGLMINSKTNNKKSDE